MNFFKNTRNLTLALCAVGMGSALAQHEVSDEIKAQWEEMNSSEVKQNALKSFNEKKYGMFIHWGIYSQVGGVWKGKKMSEGGSGPQVAEWVMRRKEIPREEYAQLATTFNPTEFDADEWVALAKAAGMNYLVITSKHHDGFALFDTKVSDFSVMKASPFKRDIIRELEQACKKGGIDFGVYYSHSIDWRDGGDGGIKEHPIPNNSKKRKKGQANNSNRFKIFTNDWDPSPTPFSEYLEKKAFPQVRELVENYDLTEIWFDTPCHMLPEQSLAFYKLVYDAQPEIVMSERIGNGMGDIGTPGDNKIPDKAIAKPWEGIATTNHSWGYASYDDDWKSQKETLYWLLENSCKGGNFLLNVGPMGNGKIPEQSIANLKAAGEWLKVNGEAIYGSKSWSINNEGPRKLKPSKRGGKKGGFDPQLTPQHLWFTMKGGHVYASALVRPEGGTVLIKAFKDQKVEAMSVLGESGEVKWTQTDEGLSVTLPEFQTATPGYSLKVTLAGNN